MPCGVKRATDVVVDSNRACSLVTAIVRLQEDPKGVGGGGGAGGGEEDRKSKKRSAFIKPGITTENQVYTACANESILVSCLCS